MGLLDGNFLNYLPDDPNKKEAMRAGLLQFGAAMLGGHGNFGQMLGQGLGAGAQGYQGQLQAQQQKQLSDAQLERWNLDNQQTKAGIAEQGAMARVMQPQEPSNEPTAASALAGGATAANVQPRGAGGVMPMGELPQVGGQSAAPSGPRPYTAAEYRAFGDKYMALGTTAAAARADALYKQADKMTPKFKEQKTLTVDGKRVVVNVNEDGSVKQLEGFAPDAEKLAFGSTGGAYEGRDPFTGAVKSSTPMTQTPDSRASTASAAAGRAQSERHFQATQEAAGANDQAPITSAAIENAAARYNVDGTLPPMGMGKSAAAGRSAILNKAAEMKLGVDPEQQRRDQLNNKGDIAARNGAIKDFSSQGKSGQEVKANNTALNHLETVSRLHAAQKNGDIKLFNQIANHLGTELGQAAPTNLAAALTMVAPEVSKAVIGVSGGVEERAAFERRFVANGSNAQAQGGIGTVRELLGGRLTETERAYARSTGNKDFREKFLSPAALEVIKRASPPAQQDKAPALPPVAVKIASDADYAKLPSGAAFITPDGHTRRKP